MEKPTCGPSAVTAMEMGTGPHTSRALPRWERVGVSRPGRETGVGRHGRSWANGIATIEAKSLEDATRFAS